MKSGQDMHVKEVWLPYCHVLIVAGYVVLDQRFHNPGINKKSYNNLVLIIKAKQSCSSGAQTLLSSMQFTSFIQPIYFKEKS